MNFKKLSRVPVLKVFLKSLRTLSERKHHYGLTKEQNINVLFCLEIEDI